MKITVHSKGLILSTKFKVNFISQIPKNMLKQNTEIKQVLKNRLIALVLFKEECIIIIYICVCSPKRILFNHLNYIIKSYERNDIRRSQIHKINEGGEIQIIKPQMLKKSHNCLKSNKTILKDF